MNETQIIAEQSSTKKSRRLYLWLFGLMLMMVLVAIAPIWVRYQRQILLIDRILELDGNVKLEPVGYTWIRECVGQTRMRGFDKITAIEIVGSSVDDSLLQDVGSSTQLMYLTLLNTEVTDAGLVYLSELTNLDTLALDSTKLTGAGLLQLKELPRLKKMWIYGQQFTDESVVQLLTLSNLRTLRLIDTNLTEAGVKELQQGLPDCKIYLSSQ